MRPVTLEIEGFGAFRDRTVVDLSDADLFAIVGATGHGKSTLIDAICFSLYGKVPRYGERDIAPAITLGTNEAKVSLTFDLGRERYVATRVLRRKPDGNGATTRGLRLERLDDTGNEIVAGSAREFEAKINELIGLSFDQFTKCVVLPQGRFAEFLHARSGDRVAILSALLDLGRYDRMAKVARGRAKDSAVRRATLEDEAARYAGASADALTAAKAGHDALVALQADVAAAGPVEAALTQEIAEAQAGAQREATIEAALTAVHLPPEVRDLADASADASAAADRAEVAAAEAEAAVNEREAAASAFPPLDELGIALQAHTERATVLERVAKGRSEHDARVAAADAARIALVAAEEAVNAAQHNFDEAQHRDAHAELRSTLAIGEPCPVCEHEVEALPPKLSAAAVTTARKALDTARKAHKAAEKQASEALAVLQRAEVLFTELDEQLTAFDERLRAFPDRAALEQQIEAARVAREHASEARTRAGALRAEATRATKAVAQLSTAMQKAESGWQAQRDALVAAGLEPLERNGDLATRWNALAEWAAEARPEHEKRVQELHDTVAGRRAERDALVGDLLGRAAEFEIVAQPSVADLTVALVKATTEAAHTIEKIETQLARAAELAQAIADEHGREHVASDLGRLLDKAHFGQWLVEEALRGLVAGASAVLERLSNRQYALTTGADGELLVVDHVNADETRSVRSLSGGETFQASLALALALAEHVAKLADNGAAALESIFLDEGFGTLDPETLDVVAGTIESLGHGERVVGIVTHVPELAERLPTRFRVRKEGRTAVVTREDA
jgi:exonuclease SbcC